jgi:hypothetical protein
VSARERTPFPKVDVQINLVRAWGCAKAEPNKSYSTIVRYNLASSTYRFQSGFISGMSLRSLRQNVPVTREIYLHAIPEEHRRAIESVERLVIGPKFLTLQYLGQFIENEEVNGRGAEI